MIRIKNLSVFALSAAAMVMAAAGCTKTEEINILDTYQRAYLSRCLVPNNEFDWVNSAGNAFTNTGFVTTTTFDFYLRTTYPAEKPVGATLCVPEDYKELVAAYNDANGTDYLPMGEEYLEYINSHATINAGSTKSRDVYSVKFANVSAPAGDYLLPISFTLDAGAPAKVSTTTHVVYLKRHSTAGGLNGKYMPGTVYALTYSNDYTYQTEGSFENPSSIFDGRETTWGKTAGSGNNALVVSLKRPTDLKYVAICSMANEQPESVDYNFTLEYRYEGESNFTAAEKTLAVTGKDVFVFDMNDYIADRSKKVDAVKVGHAGTNVYISELYLFAPVQKGAAN